MKLTHQERLDMVHALQNAAWAGRIVMRQNNKAAARIAYEYLAHGKDVKLPIVPPEWIQAVKDAQPDPEWIRAAPRRSDKWQVASDKCHILVLLGVKSPPACI